jgi:uncharacterized membrane protein YfcA
MEFFDLSLMDIAIRLILGLVIGFCIGLTGVGGGILVIPALTVILRIDPIIAVGTTTLYAFLTKITATLHHFKLKTIDWEISMRFLAGAVPANIITAIWVTHHGADEAFKASLKTFIVYVVLFSVGIMILNLIGQIRPSVEKKELSLAARINGHAIIQNVLIILMGIICGGLVGATAIGGGVLIVPILIVLFGMPAHRTVGSAIFIAFIMTMVTSLVYGSHGEQDKVTAITMAVGSLAGVYYGSKLSVKLPETLLRIIVVALILAAAVMMLFGSGGH